MTLAMRGRVTSVREICARHAEKWKNGCIWEFGMKIGLETRFGKNSLSDMLTFSQS
jgi:hypothetical protein